MNKIYQPYLNPVKFQLINPNKPDQYTSRHMDDWLFKNTIRGFEQDIDFIPKWLNNDSIRLQYISNFSPLTLKLFSCDGTEIYSIPFETKQQDFFRPGYYIRQVELDLATFEPGNYYFIIPEAGWISEPFELAEEDDPDDPTLYIEYSHSDYYGGVIFNAPFSPAIRVPGILKYKNPASVDTLYPDQDEGEIILKSIPYRIWQLITGGRKGVPPWLIDKLNRILGCDSAKIDGRDLTKNEGSNWEPVESDNYPMAGWSIELREKTNRDSLDYENETLITGKAAMMIIADSKGFGIEDNGGDFLEISDVN